MPAKPKRIVIVGEGASGKDHLRNLFGKTTDDDVSASAAGLDVSVTTRKPRPGEVAGYTYDYITQEEFDRLREAGELYEHVQFGASCYGTRLSSWRTSKVFIMSPGGVKHISKDDRKDCLVLYLNAPRSVREQRLITRYGKEQAVIRLATDDKEFDGFTDYDMRINDYAFGEELVTDLLSRVDQEDDPEA